MGDCEPSASRHFFKNPLPSARRRARRRLARKDDGGSCSQALSPVSPPLYARPTAEVNPVRHRALAPRINPPVRGSNGRAMVGWRRSSSWVTTGARGRSTRRQPTRGRCALTPLRPAWWGGGAHLCAAPSHLWGISPALRRGRREHRCGLLGPGHVEARCRPAG
jgi:hypothetical protein